MSLGAGKLAPMITADQPADDAALLTDIANLKLEQGEVTEAKEVFERVAKLRVAELKAEVEAVMEAEEEEEEDNWETLLERDPAPAGKDSSFWTSHQAKKPAPSPRSTSPAPAIQHRGRGSVVYQHEMGRDGEIRNGGASSGRRAGSSLHMDAVDAKAGRSSTSDYLHVVEVYDLNSSVREGDIQDYLRPFWWQNIGPNLEWVDETRVLAVFPCSKAAEMFLHHPHHRYRVRRFNPNVIDVADYDLMPARHRPATTTAIARKLLSHHLSRPELRDLDAEQRLRQQRQQNRNARRVRQTSADAAWEE